MRKVRVVYFYSDKPGPSRVQNLLMKELESQFKKRVEFKRIEVKKNEEAAKIYRVDDVPTIVIECNGKEKERFRGLTQELFLRRAIEKVLKECK